MVANKRARPREVGEPVRRTDVRRDDPRPLPSGRNETIEPDHFDAGTQWSHDAEMPITSRPFGASTRLLFSPPATGPSTITFAWRSEPAKPEYAVTRPSELTTSRSPDPGEAERRDEPGDHLHRPGAGARDEEDAVVAWVAEPEVVAHSRPLVSNVSAETCLKPRA